MLSYGQYCPIAKAAEIFADRWTPLIVRELLHGVSRYNELERGLPGIPRSLLTSRLRRLEQAGIVERHTTSNGRAAEYHLTRAGRELQNVVDVLGTWGARWAFGEPRPDELDPLLLVWWMQRRVNLSLLPPRRTVVQFDFRGERTGRYWLVLDPKDVSVCLQPPGFDVDLLVSADATALYRVWFGRTTFAEALRDRSVELDGATALVHAFPGWFALSPFAGAVREARDGSSMELPLGTR